MSLLQHYKCFVKQHPTLVLNLERLLHWVAWNPERFSGSEFAYEAFNAAVGLLGIYNESILAEHPDYSAAVARYALWLAAVEQVQTLVELRAIHLEQRGKMSRYSPLIVLEAVKTLLRLRLWRSSKCALALESVSKEDTQHHECDQQLKDLLQALCRLRHKYCSEPDMLHPTLQQQQYSEELTRQQIVRAAAIAPHRPPAACAVAGMLGSGSLTKFGSLGSNSSSNGSSSGRAGGDVSSSVACLKCGAKYTHAGGATCAAAAGSAGDVGAEAPPQQQQQQCRSCGQWLQLQATQIEQQQQQQQLYQHQQGSIAAASHRSRGALSGLAEITPAEQQPTNSSSSSSKFKGGWWRRITSFYPSSSSSSSSELNKQQSPQQLPPQLQHQQQQSDSTATGPESFPSSSWGPAHPSPRFTSAASIQSTKLFSSLSWCRRPGSSSSLEKGSSFVGQLQRQHLQQLPWCLCNRDASIGNSVMWFGELIYVIRPLIYVSLLKKYGLMSWKPWMLSLALDLASGYALHTGQAILGHSNANRWPGSSTLYSLALLRSLSSSKWSPGEQQELLARRVALLRYLLRSPCYNVVTRRVLEKVVSSSSWIPGLSHLTDFAFNMVEGMQGLYSYVES